MFRSGYELTTGLTNLLILFSSLYCFIKLKKINYNKYWLLFYIFLILGGFLGFVIHSFNIKSEESIFKIGLLENKYLIGAFILGTLLQIIVVVVPGFASVFKLVPLNSIQWLYIAAISVVPVVVMELQKAVNGFKIEKKVYSYKTSKSV